MKQANLLVTYDPSHTSSAKNEVQSLLESVETDAEFLESDIAGLFLLTTSKDPKQITRELRDVVEEDPEQYKYTFHWIPIEKWCKSDVNDLTREMKSIDARIKDDETWKLDLGKRQHQARSTDLIIKLTENINHPKVDLKNPQKIVKVEIVGDQAGIALLDRNELLDIARMRTGV